jgi:hypothetical protein
MQLKYVLALFVVAALHAPLVAAAAHVYLDVETVRHNRQDTFYVPVRIDTGGECVNAVRVELAYDPLQLTVRDISIGDSILTLWTEGPTVVKLNGSEVGRVVFEGGVPGGYCGRIEGDAGLTNTLAKLVVSGVVTADAEGTIRTTPIIVEPGTVVYRNDGLGTAASTTYQGVELIVRQSSTTPSNVWLADVRSDTVAPEYFEITLVEGPSAGNEKHYIAFNTVDKQSGVDHYEVLETDPERFGFRSFRAEESYWIEATSPYVLRDQKLNSKIMVKAVDENGNERIAQYTPLLSVFSTVTSPIGFVVTALVLAVLCFIVLVLVRKRRQPADDTPSTYA